MCCLTVISFMVIKSIKKNKALYFTKPFLAQSHYESAYKHTGVSATQT